MRTLSIVTLVALLAGLSAAPAPAPAVGAGTVKGRVVFAGPDLPQPKELKVNKEQAVCLARGPILDETWVIDPDTKGIRNVFVWLAPTTVGTKMPVTPTTARANPKPAEIDAPTCVYVPHSLAMREGQTLVFKNSSPINHCANWQGGRLRNPGGNVIIPPGKEHTVTNLKADTSPISLTCNIRPWMQGWVRVFDHPYYAVTGADGTFEIPDAPAGAFRIFYWHDTGYRGGEAGRKGDAIAIRPGVHDLGTVEWKP